MNNPPTPNDIASQFIIPKQQINQIAEWMGLAGSTLYSVLNGTRTLSVDNTNRLQDDLCIPRRVFDARIPIDIRKQLLYTRWYNQLTSIKDLF